MPGGAGEEAGELRREARRWAACGTVGVESQAGRWGAFAPSAPCALCVPLDGELKRGGEATLERGRRLPGPGLGLVVCNLGCGLADCREATRGAGRVTGSGRLRSGGLLGLAASVGAAPLPQKFAGKRDGILRSSCQPRDTVPCRLAAADDAVGLS